MQTYNLPTNQMKVHDIKTPDFELGSFFMLRRRPPSIFLTPMAPGPDGNGGNRELDGQQTRAIAIERPQLKLPDRAVINVVFLPMLHNFHSLTLQPASR
jgi:hypothetical protein